MLLIIILFSVLLAKLYFYWCKPSFQSNVDLTGKVILITGGNTGIGEEYVRDMARRNAKIIMAVRNVQRGLQCSERILKQTNNDQIVVEKCDLSSLSNVRSFCERIKKQYYRIDVLVCFAAAVGDNMSPTMNTEDGFEMQFQCNYLSHFLMIQLLIGLLKKSNQPRVILTASSAHLFGSIDLVNIARFESYTKHLFMAYADSKLALVMLAKELTERYEWIRANSFHPGTIYTNGIKHSYYWYLKYLLGILAFIHGKTALDGAQSMIYLSVSEEMAYSSGHYYVDCVKAKYNHLVDDRKLRRGLWNLSVALLKPFLD